MKLVAKLYKLSFVILGSIVIWI